MIDRDITFNTDDIRALQLAKGAMYNAAKILMRRLEVTELDHVVLAGAFGTCIDKVKAMAGGVFPDCDLKTTYAVGNAAGDGARICLLNTDLRTETDIVAHQVEYIELTEEADFDRLFSEAMYFPHKEDDFLHLQSLFEEARRKCYKRLLKCTPRFEGCSFEQIHKITSTIQ